MKPQRIQLRRTKGWNLQVASRLTNGLTAVNCARPSRYGNPFRVGEVVLWTGKTIIRTRAEAVAEFRAEVISSGFKFPELRGKNLACWCKSSEPCHCDILLRLANEP